MRRSHVLPLIALLAAPAALAAAAEPGTPGGLTVVLHAGAEPKAVVAEYRNGTSEEVRVPEQVMITNCLALEVRDEDGRKMGTVPPSVPWARDDGVRIPAGGVRKQKYDLDMFSPPLPPGRYSVRVCIDGWKGEPLELHVAAKK